MLPIFKRSSTSTPLENPSLSVCMCEDLQNSRIILVHINKPTALKISKIFKRPFEVTDSFAKRPSADRRLLHRTTKTLQCQVQLCIYYHKRWFSGKQPTKKGPKPFFDVPRPYASISTTSPVVDLVLFADRGSWV